MPSLHMRRILHQVPLMTSIRSGIIQHSIRIFADVQRGSDSSPIGVIVLVPPVPVVWHHCVPSFLHRMVWKSMHSLGKITFWLIFEGVRWIFSSINAFVIRVIDLTEISIRDRWWQLMSENKLEKHRNYIIFFFIKCRSSANNFM